MSQPAPPVSEDPTDLPWYIIPPPKLLPEVADGPRPPNFATWDIIRQELKRVSHFTPVIENTGHEGLYGLFHYAQLPEWEIGLDFNVPSFLVGAVSSVLVGLYFDNIYHPRKVFTWWPTSWFFNFVEEGIYPLRSTRWFLNFSKIVFKTLARSVYGTVSYCIFRSLYFWLKLKLCGKLRYVPLVDDTLASVMSAYIWSSKGYPATSHTAYDRIIWTGWISVFNGILEYSLYSYFLERPPPGLFRWLFGGAFYGPGIWRYLIATKKPGPP